MIYLYLIIWVLGTVVAFPILSNFFYHAVDMRQATRRVLKGMNPGRNIYWQSHWAIAFGSVAWLILLPGLLLASLLRLEGLAGTFQGWVALCLLNLPWWSLLWHFA